MATESTALHRAMRKRARHELYDSPSTQSGTEEGHTPRVNLANLCSTCQSLLIRPNYNPETQRGAILTKPPHALWRSASEIKHAMSLCCLCKLVMASFKTIGQHSATREISGFDMALGWSISGRFRSIDIIPLDEHNLRTTWCETYHSIKLVPEDETENKCISYQSPPNTSAKLCQSLAMRWFVSCIAEHSECREIRSPEEWLPTRLIDVGLADSLKSPRLISTNEHKHDNSSSYVALSHRWTSINMVKLESSNITSFMQRIPTESLPRTFLDAIDFTRSLGVRYLWIDSLCILQDSLEDWQAEASQMGKIYRNCVCNIAATGSSDHGGGLFQERNEAWVTPEKVRIQYRGHDRIYFAFLGSLWGKWVSRSTLNRRGWVFQERLLSPRTLHFSSQLFWECRRLLACETFPEGMPDDELDYQDWDGSQYTISLKDWQNEYKGTNIWTYFVESFGRCSITKPEDRLVAIAGVAKSLQPLLDDEYLAGLWKNDLPYNLGWSLLDVDGKLQLPKEYRCPSWSWAALDFHSALIRNSLIHPRDRVKALARVLEVHIEPLGSDAFGLLRGGYLRLASRIGQIFSLTDIHGVRRHGRPSFEGHLDGHLRLESIGDKSLHCLPIFVSRPNFTFVDCLLLKELKPGAFEYTRVGLLKVSLEVEDELLPQEIRWITEYANSEPCFTDLVAVTIY